LDNYSQGFGAINDDKFSLLSWCPTLIYPDCEQVMTNSPAKNRPTPAMINDRPIERDPFVQSFARGLSIITCFDADHPVMTLSQISERVDLSRASTRRFLLTLENLGYVSLKGRNFQLTAKVLDLGEEVFQNKEV
jgi:hypothetical protein